MPDYFSHAILAERVFDGLSAETRAAIDSKDLYLLGAEGGDLYFFYKAVPTKTNVGRRLHAEKAADIFEKLIVGDFSYAAGFATHYAADATLHPAVYAFCRGKKKMFIHQSFEDDLGLYISRKFGMRRALMPRERMLACTYPVYESAKLLCGDVTLSGVERGIKRYYAYCRRLFSHKKSVYKNNYDFASLSDTCDKAVDLGVKCVESLRLGKVDGDLFSLKFLQGKVEE